MSLHWLTRWDPDDGEPYGEVCRCEIGKDHDGAGNPFPVTADDPEPEDAAS
jgi:hypothetical protein